MAQWYMAPWRTGTMAHPNGFNVFNHLNPCGGQTYLAGFEIFESDHLVYAKPAWRNEENNLDSDWAGSKQIHRRWAQVWEGMW